MPNAYFQNIPTIQYRGKYAKNIILRAAFVRSVIKNYFVFYPHVIEDGQTAEQIAFDYYGDCDLDWMVWFSNNIIDPYYEWPMTQELFDNYIRKTYGTFENAVEGIRHYVYNPSVDASDANQYYAEGYEMTPETYSFLSPVGKSYWKPVTFYDWEFTRNEAKRTIQLLDNRYKDQVLKEISEIMK